MIAKPLVSVFTFFPVFMSVAVFLSSCAGLGLSPDQAPETAEQKAYRKYLSWVEKEIVPRAEAEVREMMRLGWVRSLDDIDLWHLHIGYPSESFPEDPESVSMSMSQLHDVHKSAPYHLLYHSMERPHEMRRSWMNALAVAESKELRAWIGEIEEHEFDYRDFFFSSGRYTRPPALDPATLARYAELWAAEDSPERPPDIQRLREYRNRLSFIVGSTQPGYFRAARELLHNSSIVSRMVETETGYTRELGPVSHRYPPGYHYPVMIVFGPSANGAPFFGASQVMSGEELVFGVRALVYTDSQPR